MPAKINDITSTILEKLKAGTKPWHRPYAVTTPFPLRATHESYRGFNIIWLWMVAQNKGYASPYWMTYRHALSQGGQVRKGERGTLSYFYKPMFDEDDDTVVRSWILRTFRVFNADQIDDLPETFRPETQPVTETERTARIDAFLAAMPAKVEYRGNSAFYDITNDIIVLPQRGAFDDDDSFAAVFCHELAHFTGHASRLNRQFGKRFGDQETAFEELIAEISSAILGAELGLPTTLLDNHASYIKNWVSLLEDEPRAILSAGKHAEAAVSYLFDLAGMERPSYAARSVTASPDPKLATAA